MKKLYIIKYVYEKLKDQIMIPYMKGMMLVFTGKGCYDYGKYQVIVNGAESNVGYITQIQSMMLGLYNLDIVVFMATTLNNVAYYIGLPLKIVTYISIILIILFIILILQYIYRWGMNRSNKVSSFGVVYENELRNTMTQEIKKIYDQVNNNKELLKTQNVLTSKIKKMEIESLEAKKVNDLLISKIKKLENENERIKKRSENFNKKPYSTKDILDEFRK